MREAFVAVDFGGGSGRVIAGTISGGRMELYETHRFANRQVRMGGHTYWDFPALFAEMLTGLRKTVEAGFRILSVGIDTWGVDFGFIDAQGNLLGNPVCYRDQATEGCAAAFFSTRDTARHYSQSGIQIMDINSLYRLVAMRSSAPSILGVAHRLLFMPDLFSYFLTGEANNEYTIASTSELIDARTRTWNRELIRDSGLPEHIFGRIVIPGEKRGWLTDDVRRETGIGYDVPVIAVGSHDTASAAFSVKNTYGSDGTAFLSSGTWSLLGVAMDEPLLTEEARLGGFTNEGGVDGKILFMQNITGLWILQNLVARWEQSGLRTDYPYLVSEAERSAIRSVIDVDAPEFLNPQDMAHAIADHCRDHGLEVPQTQGDYVHCVLLSLADRYRRGVEAMNPLLPRPVSRLRIIGGGSRNGLLNRLTAEATGLPVEAGPAEATAMGNILVQAREAGIDIASVAL